jgi:hypothetical protein
MLTFDDLIDSLKAIGVSEKVLQFKLGNIGRRIQSATQNTDSTLRV